jgi:hypothetical protein
MTPSRILCVAAFVAAAFVVAAPAAVADDLNTPPPLCQPAGDINGPDCNNPPPTVHPAAVTTIIVTVVSSTSTSMSTPTAVAPQGVVSTPRFTG